jgi:hypothetical protein
VNRCDRPDHPQLQAIKLLLLHEPCAKPNAKPTPQGRGLHDLSFRGD